MLLAWVILSIPLMSGAKTFDLAFAWMPQDNAFTQKLSGVRFEPNSEGVSLLSYSILARYNEDEVRFYEFEHTEVQAWMAQLNSSTFNVRDSKTSLDATMFRGFFCYSLGMERARYCIGGEFGRDSAPILTFESTDMLSIDEAKSFVAGPSLIIQYPASPEVAIHLKGYTLFGLSAQNTDKATLKSDWKFGTQAGANYRVDEHQMYQFTIDYMIRQAKIETPIPTGTLTWNSIFSGLTAHFTYVYSF